MAKRKRKFYYIAIIPNKIGDNTIKFVDNIDYGNKWASWKTWDELREKKLKAYKFTSMIDAEQIAEALFINGHIAMVVRPFIEIE